MVEDIDKFFREVNELESEQNALIKTKEILEEDMRKIVEKTKLMGEELDVVTNAISILRVVSDNSVHDSYELITTSVNSALDKIFVNNERKIKLNEYTRQGQYPQLELILEVEGGVRRSLKLTGHGLTQIISLLCILVLIVVNKSRRILVMDEILSGLSKKSRAIIAEILWVFTEIGFQFIIAEHGFLIKGSKVYHIENVGGIGRIKEQYIEQKGVYLDLAE